MHPVPHILVRAMTHSNRSRYYRPRAMSLENPKILEALTIYEKLKRCQEEDQELDSGLEQNHEFRGDHNNQQDIFDSKSANDHKLQLEAEEPLPLDPFSPNFDHVMDENRELMAYSKYKDINLQDANYLYFSAETGLIQSQTLEGLSEEEEEMNYKELLLSKKYWLDVVNPTDNDLTLLSSAFGVHELTIRDIRGNTEEKLEMYNHYTFVSLKLMKEPNNKEMKYNTTNSKKNPAAEETSSFHQQPFCPNSKKHQKYSSSCSCGGPEDDEEKDEEKEYLNLDLEDEISNEETSNTCASSNDQEESDSFYLPTHSDYVESDADLKILVFADFIITIHKVKWESVKDVLGFLSILLDYGGSTPPMPEWVLFSIFVELAQEAKLAVRKLTPTILSMRAAQLRQEGGLGVDVFKLSNVLRQNFQFEFELHKICRFIKPKLQVLRAIQLKGRRRFPNVPGVVRFLANVGSEFDELLDELDNLSRVVERSQDTFLALASVQQSLEANEMGEIMKRISEIAMIFLPVQAIAGFLGMNVPFQEEGSTFPFWTIVMGSVIIAASLFIGKRIILCRKKYCARVDLCPSISSMKKSATTRYEKSKVSQKLKGL
ncbi:Magnesium transporter ALR1 [Folsomia candida]|uniref:Magnesium transporter ALR1 n=1 Tax=Folsomia candida TaxID=158441 RepID=A0A226ERY1_FOLCA|nr:Magnesium transporter ALR1 [Folsomia candida]